MDLTVFLWFVIFIFFQNMIFQFQSRFPPSHWSSLRCIIVIFNDREKSIGSTVGMQRTVQTSSLLKRRIQIDVPERVDRLEFANILFIYF